jgi:hypothetical protein
MIHRIEFEEGDCGKTYISRIIFNTALDSEYEMFEGYEGKTFEQLCDEGEIVSYSTDDVVANVDVLEFTRPISMSRFLLMFGRLGVEGKKGLEFMLETDAETGFTTDDPKKYVF